MKRVAVIGDGGWGTALALVLHENGHQVTVWGPFPDHLNQVSRSRENERFLPGVKIPGEIAWTADPASAVHEADAVVLAMPTKFFRTVLEQFTGLIPASAAVVTVAKGLDKTSHQRMSEVAAECLQPPIVAALSGPSHAEEVARGIPTAVTLACGDPAGNQMFQELFATSRFRVYTSADLVGVELGGALKNVIAIAVGMSDGLGFGDNTRAALITRGLSEITRLGCALGAEPATFAGLSGTGDLIVTCTSRLSRNRSVGERLGRGETLEQILGSTEQATEGVWNCASARALAHRIGVDVPITEQVYAIVHEDKPPQAAVADLLSRDLGPETK